MKGSPTKRRSLRSYQESKDNSSMSSSTSNTNMHKFDENEMNKLVIWRHPIQTVYYFAFELVYLIVCYVSKLLQYRKLVLSCLLFAALVTAGFYAEGSHLNVLLHLRKKGQFGGLSFGHGEAVLDVVGGNYYHLSPHICAQPRARVMSFSQDAAAFGAPVSATMAIRHI